VAIPDGSIQLSWRLVGAFLHRRPRQPALSLAPEHPYEFAGAAGWDGQWYHAIAHDPLLRRGTAPFIDSARLRYRRILVPALAFLLAAGNDAFIDPAYRLTLLLFLALGAAWLARLAMAARILSLLLFFEALPALDGPLAPALVPLAMVVPRFGVEMGSQMIGVSRGLL